MFKPAAFMSSMLLLAMLLQPAVSMRAHSRMLKQNAGTGAGCDSIFSDFDTGTGETTEDIEDTVAGDITNGAHGKKLLSARRLKQNAGTGAGCDSIFSDFDTGTGETTEDAEDTIAGDIDAAHAGKKLLSTGVQATGRTLQQLNRIGDGAGNIIDAAGDPQLGAAVATTADDYDGDGTDDLADIGGEIGQLELNLPDVAQAIPGRKLQGTRALKQLNRIGDGAGNIIDAAGDPQLGAAVATTADDYDGDGTNDLADTGEQIGQLELDLPDIAQAIPGKK